MHIKVLKIDVHAMIIDIYQSFMIGTCTIFLNQAKFKTPVKRGEK